MFLPKNAGVLTLIHLAWSFVVLTRPDGLPITIKVEAVDYFTPAIKQNVDPRAHTEIDMESGKTLYVREQYEDVVRLMRLVNETKQKTQTDD